MPGGAGEASPSPSPPMPPAGAGGGVAGAGNAAAATAVTAPSSSSESADHVGDYIVGKEIGRGSFANVYLGRLRHPSSSSSYNNYNAFTPSSSSSSSAASKPPSPSSSSSSVSSRPAASAAYSSSSDHHPGAAATLPMWVAIKTVTREKLNRKLAENLESEIKILKQINHQNIVGLYDIVKTDKYIHLIMEFCSMGDLSAYIKKRGVVVPLSVDGSEESPRTRTIQNIVTSDPTVNPIAGAWGGLNEMVVRHFLLQLASAIEFLRAHSLIHRDVKPQNLLLSPPHPSSPDITLSSPFRNGPGVQVKALPLLKLADFGFARALPQQSLASTLCGSPLYMAPEILRGDRYDAKADLWSVGAVLYETLTGRPPFKAQNHVDLLRRIDKGEGHIRFPGEDDTDSSKRSVMASPGHRLSGISPSPSKNLASNLVIGSLGSSPRFPAPIQGALGISEDLKDLIRRLLKRNPVERMSFEEFFLHPAVTAGVLGTSMSDWLSDASRPVEFSKQPLRDPSSSPSKLQRPVLPRTSSESLRQLQEAAAIGSAKAKGILPNPATPTGSDTSHHLGDRSEGSGQSRISNDFRTVLSQEMFFRGELLSGAATNVGGVGEGRLSPHPSAFQSPEALMNLEPPFPGYDVDPVKVFGDLIVPAPQPLVALPGRDEAHSPASPPSRSREDKDALSSISSLGSIELSDEGDEVVGIVKRGAATPPSKLASPRPTPLGQTPTLPAPTSPRPETELLRPDRAGLVIPATKTSFDEYVVVEKKVVEVNWLADEVAASTAPMATDPQPHPSSRDGSPSRPNSFHAGQSVSRSGSPALYNLAPAMHVPVPLRNARSGSFSSLDRPKVESRATPPSPRSSPRSSMAGRFVAAVSAVAGMVTGGSGGSVSSTTNHGTGGGGGGGGNSSGLYGSTPESNGRIFSRSLEAGGGGAGGRILGSLRESAHHFLDASTNSLSPHQLNYPPALMHQQQHVPATPFAVQPGSIPPFATASPSPTTVAATAWTAGGGGILKFGDIASLSTSAENMLTILNLLSIRAHAVNVVAEERHAELSQLAVAQLAAATSTSSGAGGLSGSLSIGAGTAAAAAVAADEVLTLYLGALGTYQSAMEIAKVVWDREQARRKGDPAAVAAAAAPPLVALAGAGDGTTGDGASSAAATAAAAGTVDLVSLSAAVQWIRERFNECLERAEEARRWIPGESSGSAVGSYSSSEDGPVGRPRSFERLLYERALDIAKVAATHEAEGRLREAEADYVRAGLLLESAVQSVATAGAGGGGGSSLSPQSQDGSGTGAAAATAAAESDRVVMEQFIASLMKRLAKVQQLARGS